MTALGIRLRAQLRTRWRAWLTISLIAGTLGGLVIGLAAATKRTQGSYRRYLASINSADVYVDPFVDHHGDSLPLDGVAALPQVAATERSVQLGIIARSRSGAPILPAGKQEIGWVLPTDDRTLDKIDRLKVLSGRLPDPRQPNEVIGDTKALHILGVHVGESFLIRTIDQRALDTFSIHLTADPKTARGGRLIRLHVTGVAANARADVDGGQMHLTPAFFHTYGERKLGAFIEELVVKLRHGQRDLPAFKQALGKYAGKRPFLEFEPSAGHPKIQRSIDLSAQALRIVAVLGGLAFVVIVGQMQLRLASEESDDDDALRALGADASHQLAYAAARAAIVAVPAAALATVIAYLFSPLAPIGWARELDPKTGFEFASATIVPGAIGVVAVIFVFAMAGAIRQLLAGNLTRPRYSRAQPYGSLNRLAHGHGSPAFQAGVRMALGSSGERAPRGTIAAGVIAVGVCVTALTFAACFHHLTSTPRLYGQTWDYETFGGPAQPARVVRALTSDRGLSSVAAGADDTVAVNGVDTGVRSWDNLKGRLEPTIISGRGARRPGEIVLGANTLAAAHAHVGGFVTVRGRGGPHRLRVVGQGVLPSSKFNKLGGGGILTFKGLKVLDPGSVQGLFLLSYAPGQTAAVRKRLDFFFDGNIVIAPDEVGDFGRIAGMPLYIALLAVLIAAAALGHALVIRVRRGRRDVAILKTLGFTRAQAAAAVAWEATTIVAISVAIGVPLGLAIGRFAWRVFATDLGVAPEVVLPIVPALVLLPLGAFLFANVLAAIPGWLAARVKPAPALRTE